MLVENTFDSYRGYRALGLSPLFGERVLFFDSYFDESISPGRDLVVAGYIATIENWADFALVWKTILGKYNLPYFRMKDFKNRNSSLFRHLSAAEREHLFKLLLWMVGMHAGGGISCRINIDDYNSIINKQARQALGSPYAFAVCFCTAIIYRSLVGLRHLGDPTFGVMLETGHRNAINAMDLLGAMQRDQAGLDFSNNARRPMISAIGLGTKREHAPLQAADILAHCTLAPTSDLISTSTLTLLKGAFQHSEISIDKKTLQAFSDLALLDKSNELRTKHQLHILRRMLGWLGAKMEEIPGGFRIDQTNPKPVDLAQMIKAFEKDPSTKLTISRNGKPWYPIDSQ